MYKKLIISLILSVYGFSQVLIVEKGEFNKEKEFLKKNDEIILREGNCFGVKFKSDVGTIFKLKNNKGFPVVEEHLDHEFFPAIYCLEQKDLNYSGRWVLSLKNKHMEEYSFAYFNLKPENNISNDLNISVIHNDLNVSDKNITEIIEDFKIIETSIKENTSENIISSDMLKSI